MLTEAGLSGQQDRPSSSSSSLATSLIEQLERLVMMLVAAGVEGGPKPRIERTGPFSRGLRPPGPLERIWTASLCCHLGIRLGMGRQTHLRQTGRADRPRG